MAGLIRKAGQDQENRLGERFGVRCHMLVYDMSHNAIISRLEPDVK